MIKSGTDFFYKASTLYIRTQLSTTAHVLMILSVGNFKGYSDIRCG